MLLLKLFIKLISLIFPKHFQSIPHCSLCISHLLSLITLIQHASWFWYVNIAALAGKKKEKTKN